MTTPLQRLWHKYAHILTNERKWIGDIWQQRLVAWLTKEMCSALKRALIRIWRAGMQANIDLHYSVQCVWRILIISKTFTGIQMQMHTIQYKIATDRSPINTAIGTFRRIRLLLLANIESKYTHTHSIRTTRTTNGVFCDSVLFCFHPHRLTNFFSQYRVH